MMSTTASLANTVRNRTRTIYRQARHEPHAALLAAPCERVYELIRGAGISMRWRDIAEALNVTPDSLDFSLKTLIAAGRISRVKRGCYRALTTARPMPPPPIARDSGLRPLSLSQLMAGRA